MNALLLVINGLLIAATYAFRKIAGQLGMSPLGLLFWQVTGSAAILLAVCAAMGERPAFKPDFLRYYLLAGLLGLTLPSLVTYSVLAAIPAGVVGVVASLSPLLTYAIVCGAQIERPQPGRLIGLALGLTGVLAILLPQGALPTAGMAACLLLAFAAPLSLAAGNVYRSLAWPAGGKPLAMAAGMLLTQAILLAPPALLTGAAALPAAAPAASAVVAIMTLIAAAFYLTSFELQRRAGPVYVGQLGYVISLASLLIGVLFFDEQPSAWVWLAAAIIVGGVVMVSRQGAAARPATAARVGVQS